LRDQLRHAIADRQNHVAVRHHGGTVHHGAVTRNDLGIGTGARDDLAQAIDHAVKAAAVDAVNVRILDRTVEIAGHDHVGIHEANHGVAIGMGGGNRNQLHVFAVHVERGEAVEGDHGKPWRRGGCAWGAIGVGRGMHQPVAEVFAGQDGDAHLAQVFIAAGMIAVNVRIDHKLNLTIGDFADGGHDFFRQRGELGVHHKDAVRA
jgi:hypothetical protein